MTTSYAHGADGTRLKTIVNGAETVTFGPVEIRNFSPTTTGDVIPALRAFGPETVHWTVSETALTLSAPDIRPVNDSVNDRATTVFQSLNGSFLIEDGVLKNNDLLVNAD